MSNSSSSFIVEWLSKVASRLNMLCFKIDDYTEKRVRVMMELLKYERQVRQRDRSSPLSSQNA